jgi:hypothetical protein
MGVCVAERRGAREVLDGALDRTRHALHDRPRSPSLPSAWPTGGPLDVDRIGGGMTTYRSAGCALAHRARCWRQSLAARGMPQRDNDRIAAPARARASCRGCTPPSRTRCARGRSCSSRPARAPGAGTCDRVREHVERHTAPRAKPSRARNRAGEIPCTARYRAVRDTMSRRGGSHAVRGSTPCCGETPAGWDAVPCRVGFRRTRTTPVRLRSSGRSRAQSAQIVARACAPVRARAAGPAVRALRASGARDGTHARRGGASRHHRAPAGRRRR